MVKAPNVIAITGASSGLGKALALEYARDGGCLHLFGRNQEALSSVAIEIGQRGGQGIVHACDVLDQAGMSEALTTIDQVTPIDLVIANAGISAGTSDGDEDDAQTRQIFDTNLYGVLNTVLPLLPLMRSRKCGQIAIMSSMASFRGLASAPAYCASKAAVRTWGEALRADAERDNVQVNVICPGFVRTPLTDCNNFDMPFLMDADRAAHIMRRGLAANRGRIVFPWPMIIASWCLRALPDGLLNWLSRKLPKK